MNPAVHEQPAAEAARQLGLGAVAVKLHPVHGAFRPDAKGLYAVYDLCAERGVPVIVHTGGSIFPGSQPEVGDPGLMSQVIADFPGVEFVLAHGGRGQWYADAAELALAESNVWLDLAGLPPKRLPDYYAAFDLPELARKWIFGTDWPGVPGRGKERARGGGPRPARGRPGRRDQRQRGPRLPAGLAGQPGRAARPRPRPHPRRTFSSAAAATCGFAGACGAQACRGGGKRAERR